MYITPLTQRHKYLKIKNKFSETLIFSYGCKYGPKEKENGRTLIKSRNLHGKIKNLLNKGLLGHTWKSI